MEVVELLKKEHVLIRGVLDEITRSTGRGPKRRIKLLDELRTALAIHGIVEDEALFPRMIKLADTREAVLLIHEAQSHSESLAEQLSEIDPTEPAWEVCFASLKSTLEHRLEREERELFPHIRRLLAPGQRRGIGSLMLERTRQLRSAVQDSREELPPGPTGSRFSRECIQVSNPAH